MTTPKRPRTILAVEEMLTERTDGMVDARDLMRVKLDMSVALLADANREIERLEARPERITVACAGEGNCYEAVSYDADDLRETGLADCLSDDGWHKRGDGFICPACKALDGPAYDRSELASKE